MDIDKVYDRKLVVLFVVDNSAFGSTPETYHFNSGREAIKYAEKLYGRELEWEQTDRGYIVNTDSYEEGDYLLHVVELPQF